MRIEDLTPTEQDALIKSGQLDGDPARIAELKRTRRPDYQSDGCVPLAGLPSSPPGPAPAYLTKPQPDYDYVEGLRVSLKHAISIIEAHVPRDALGMNAQGDADVQGGFEQWPLLDEYFHHMREALSVAELRARIAKVRDAEEST